MNTKSKQILILSAILFVASQVSLGSTSDTLAQNTKTHSSKNKSLRKKATAKNKSTQIKKNKTQKSNSSVSSKNTYCVTEIESCEIPCNENITCELIKEDTGSTSVPYQPYLELGGTRFFSGPSKSAGGFDLFIPIWQSPSELIFSDARFYDRSGKPFEGNIHLGYRRLFVESQTMFGIYGAFDRKRSELGNYYNQLTFGAEVWLDKLFIGGNVYQPVGNSSKRHLDEDIKIKDFTPYKDITISSDKSFEKSLPGVDAQVGYEFTNALTGYVGGYYFKTSGTNSVAGPKARLTYDWSLDNGKRILEVFDKLGLEVGIQRDQIRGTLGYLSVNIRIGLMPEDKANLRGVARHMVDLIRRDVDIITAETPVISQVIQQRLGYAETVEDVIEQTNDTTVTNISIEKDIEFDPEDVGKLSLENLAKTEFEYGDELVVVTPERTKQLAIHLHEGSIRIKSGDSHKIKRSFGNYVRSRMQAPDREFLDEYRRTHPKNQMSDESLRQHSNYKFWKANDAADRMREEQIRREGGY